MSLAHVRQGFGCVRPYVYGPHSLWTLLREASVPASANDNRWDPTRFISKLR
jgi:hypothetical protein